MVLRALVRALGPFNSIPLSRRTLEIGSAVCMLGLAALSGAVVGPVLWPDSVLGPVLLTTFAATIGFVTAKDLLSFGVANRWRTYADLWRELAYAATEEPPLPEPDSQLLSTRELDPALQENIRLQAYRAALRARARELEQRRPGRRRGSGAFRSREHFVAVMHDAVRDILARNGNPTQPAVSRWLDAHDDVPAASVRTLKTKTKEYGYPSWEALLAEVQ